MLILTNWSLKHFFFSEKRPFYVNPESPFFFWFLIINPKIAFYLKMHKHFYCLLHAYLSSFSSIWTLKSNHNTNHRFWDLHVYSRWNTNLNILLTLQKILSRCITDHISFDTNRKYFFGVTKYFLIYLIDTHQSCQKNHIIRKKWAAFFRSFKAFPMPTQF